MVKRRVVQESESDEDIREATPPGKRARRDSSNVFSGASTYEEAMDEDEQDGGHIGFTDAVDEEAEREYEARNEAYMRAALSKKAARGGIAECGVIKSITVKEFMCHTHLTLDFGPQVNFITGRNGSGKSAILSALQIGLGARAFLTGRGTGLKSFIREGKNKAEVIIKMKNQGPEAFKHDLYGDTIIIHRTFTKEGSSSWQIKSVEGKVIAKNKRELSELVENMNIQIDSPLNVLTQDHARQFLATSSPSDKYNFFLKGTQLAQLTEEYSFVRENIRRTSTFLKQKAEALPELQQAHEEAVHLRKEATKAARQKDRIKELKLEKAWCIYNAKAAELRKEEDELAEREKQLEKIENKLQTAKDNVAIAKTAITEFQQQQTDDTTLKALKDEQKELKAKIKAIKDQVSHLTNAEQDMNSNMITLGARIAEADKEIDAERKKLQDDRQEEREAIQQELNDRQDELTVLESRLLSLGQQKQAAETEISRLRESERAAVRDVQKHEAGVHTATQRIQDLQASRPNKYTVYGRNIEAVIRAIGSRRWSGAQRPIGPLGIYATLKNDVYRALLQTQLGSLMSAFVVANVQDRRDLQKLLRECGHHAEVIISEPDMFDYSSGVPRDHRIETPLHVLEITDEWAKRVLINQAHIEKIALASSRSLADEIVKGNPGMTAWSNDGYRVMSYREGGGQSIPLRPLDSNDQRRSLFLGTDSKAAITQAEDNLRESKNGAEVAARTLSQIRSQLQEQERTYNSILPEGNTLQRKRQELQRRIGDLKEKSREDQPTNIGAMITFKEELEAEMESIKVQFKAAEEKKHSLNAEAHGLVQRSNLLVGQIREIEVNQNQQRTHLETLVENAFKADKEEGHWQTKTSEAKDRVEKHLPVVNRLRETHESWLNEVKKFGPEVTSTRSVEAIDAEISALEKSVRDREKRHGKSVEELDVEVQRTQKVLEDAEQNLAQLKAFNKCLWDALNKRMFKWHAFRRAIALRAKIQFQYHLSRRDFTGNVIFDHVNKTLNLRVQTEEGPGSQIRDKDPKSLSGGEKSYAQICLLLALWEAIACPMRCLDEFDVFMDGVNRRVSTTLMMDAATTCEEKQFLFISPLEVGSFIKLTDQVKLVRMPDPERGQQTLPFTAA